MSKKIAAYDPETGAPVRRTKTAEQALSSLMRLCSRAEKSSGDALRLMYGWGVPEADRPGVLQRLIDDKFIDDARYAAAYVREKMRLGGWGAHKISRMLASKGIARPLIEQALALYGRDDRKERLREMLEKKCRNTKATGTYELKGKLMRYGLSLGHDYDDVKDAVENVVASTEIEK